MQIAIIGAGNVGKALGIGWSRAGHTIHFGVPDPTDPKHHTTARAAGDAIVATLENATAAANVVVLAVPWDAVPSALTACGNLTAKILLDATNPLKSDEDGLTLAIGFSTSGGEQVARLAPGAAVFKTMNQVGFAVMSDTRGYAAAPAMFVAGDNAEHKPMVMALVSDLGFGAIDAGPLRMARLLEPYAMLWIDQAINHGAATDNAFAMLHRSEMTKGAEK